jgi:hypothetical protein
MTMSLPAVVKMAHSRLDTHHLFVVLPSYFDLLCVFVSPSLASSPPVSPAISGVECDEADVSTHVRGPHACGHLCRIFI